MRILDYIPLKPCSDEFMVRCWMLDGKRGSERVVPAEHWNTGSFFDRRMYFYGIMEFLEWHRHIPDEKLLHHFSNVPYDNGYYWSGRLMAVLRDNWREFGGCISATKWSKGERLRKDVEGMLRAIEKSLKSHTCIWPLDDGHYLFTPSAKQNSHVLMESLKRGHPWRIKGF